MVCFAKYGHTFLWKDRVKWTVLLVKAYNGEVLEISKDSGFDNGIKTKATQEDLSDLFHQYENDRINPINDSDSIHVKTKRIWDEIVFRNFLSLPKWDTLTFESPSIQDAEKVKIAIESIVDCYDSINPQHEMGFFREVDIPCNHIGFIVNQVNKSTPLSGLYYSPSKEILLLQWPNHLQLCLNKNKIVNTGHFILDLDDGFSRTYFPEMQQDFEEWKTNGNLGTEIFKLRKPFI